MVCVVELDTIAIHQADGRVRTEGRGGELFQEIPPNLKVCVLLTIRFICLGFLGPPFCNLIVRPTRSRPVMYFLNLPTGPE